MHSTRWLKCAVLIPAAIATVYATSAFSGGPEYIDHAFAFDARSDSPGIQILDFKYGDGTAHGTRNPKYLMEEGRPLQRISVRAPMRRPDSLYVKWHIKSQGSTYEDTVDLRSRLPQNLTGKRVYFMINGAQLEVYLISPERRRADAPSVGPAKYRHRTVSKIYPD